MQVQIHFLRKELLERLVYFFSAFVPSKTRKRNRRLIFFNEANVFPMFSPSPSTAKVDLLKDNIHF